MTNDINMPSSLWREVFQLNWVIRPSIRIKLLKPRESGLPNRKISHDRGFSNIPDKIAHTKHFASDIFSLLSNATPRISPRPSPAELSYLEALLGRLHAPGKSKQTTSDWRAQSHSPDILLQAVDSSRESFSCHARRTKLGFNLVRIVIQFLSLSKKDKLLDRWRGAAAISKVLDGDGVNGLAGLLKKLPSADLKVLLGELHEYLQNVPEEIRDAELASRNKIVMFRKAFAAIREVDTALARVVYRTVTVPIRGTLINPALRSSIVSGVLFPHSYTGQETVDDKDEDLQALPDTTILFKGYIKAGKMINIVLTTTATPAKGGKGKGKKSEPEPGTQERWRLSVQARFVRALHELAFVGFIKHTSRSSGGRKGEYVLRTVLGVVE
ncbi:hypothetical protein GGX14DRAFT_544406 [Mycena pura]|uniref:Origin recognition complex subunit 3 winged helix C-terminal domain-containing protein n=1 Tax=Mycena pura TaxID=153505 RepID=A0AAD6V8Q8_9AGAR|nr:hypothetical protein GGX14DRAFT_544406 [Mycena pura]